MAHYPNEALYAHLLQNSSILGSIYPTYDIFSEWELGEVIDTMGLTDYECPCGRTGLDYLCLVSNRITQRTTYVGPHCMQFFTNPMVSEMFSIIRSTIRGEFVKKQRNAYTFAVTSSCPLVSGRQILRYFYASTPLRWVSGRWVVTIHFCRHPCSNRYPRLIPGRSYRIRLSPITGISPDISKPRLRFGSIGVTTLQGSYVPNS